MPRSKTMKPSSMPLGIPKTLLGIEFDVIRPEFHKGLLKIGNQMVSPFRLNYDIVNVGLNGPPDEVPESSEHTALIRSPNVL